MARPLRIEFSGACYHIINRGNFAAQQRQYRTGYPSDVSAGSRWRCGVGVSCVTSFCAWRMVTASSREHCWCDGAKSLVCRCDPCCPNERRAA
mgnify:CR=1 FL=1